MGIGVAAALAAVLPPLPSGAAGGPPYTQHVYERVLVPMRDGVRLSVDIWRPVTGGLRVPVILSLTPYHALYKALDRTETDLPGEWNPTIRAGYAFARADVRGTYGSGGCWDYGGAKERQDGYDLVEWLAGYAPGGSPSAAAQWSTGKVAMTGVSYDGTTANAAAVEHPPHLVTIIPVSAISRWWGYAYQQGARSSSSGESADIDPPSDTPTDFMFGYGFLPPPDPIPDHATQIAMRWTPCDRAEQTLHGYDTQPDYDAFWEERDYLRLASTVTIPVLVAHGLLDFNVKTWEGTAWFQALGGPKRLWIGQWPHASPGGSWSQMLRRWLDRWLRDVPNGVEGEPAVTVQGSDGLFRAQATWGAAPLAARPLSGGVRTIIDDGALTESEMLRGVGAQRYVRVAVPSTAGPLHVEGRPVLRLSASSDSPSTHLVAVLCDVGPDGACTVVSRAFLNARFRGSLDAPSDLVPGARYTFPLEFIDKDWYVAPGRHLELLVASSSTTWVLPDERRATNTIFLDDSTLDLPLAP